MMSAGTLPLLMISAMQGVLGLASGSLVGFSLGLVGGGGSVLAVPLMVYVVGVPDPHLAIGTSAIAVATNAAVNLSNHARGGTVRWGCALTFAAAGIVGAFVGSIFGKMLDGQKLLALFAVLMLVIAMLMLKTRARVGLPDVQMDWSNLPAIVAGTTLGMLAANVPVVFLGNAFAARLPMKAIHYAASALFAVLGFYFLWAAARFWGLV